MRRRSWWVALAGTVLIPGMTAASAQVTVGPAEFTGRWSLPFEEGGLGTPACWEADDGRLECKPVGQAMAMLADGRAFYYSGLEGQENASPGPSSADMRDSPSRLLDLRTGTPQWSTPSTPAGGASNPDVRQEGPAGDPAGAAGGMAGVPGRPGDGLVGSAWGAAGGPEMAPTAPPDDPEANDGDMFCGDIASLADGRQLIMGGGDWYDEPGVGVPGDDTAGLGLPEVEGLRSARIFDPVTSTFIQTGNMKYHRWYPGSVTLPDGKVLVAGGATKRVKNTQASHVRRTETFDPATGQFTENYTGMASETSLPLSPRLHLLPTGKVIYPAAGQGWAPFGATADEALYGMLQQYDPAARQWEMLSPHMLGTRDGAASVLLPLDPPYEKSTVLTFGGALGPPPGGDAGVPLSTLLRVDGTGKISEKLTRYSMLEGRWNPSAVGLPDGTVLAVGGATTSDTTAPGTGVPVRTVELFDLRTEAWYSMARISRDRTYHHSAVLLPDGRVLLGGHAPPSSTVRGGDLGGPFPNNDRDPSFEIFSPHYLFRGERPLIRHVQAGIRWGETFDLETRQALTTDSVVLVRLGSPQHSIDSDQRTVRLAFTRHSGRLAVSAPPNGAVAPPGSYYLFLNLMTRRGPIPSMARVVRIGPESDPSEAHQPFPDLGRPEEPLGSANEDGDSSPTAPVDEQVSELVGVKMFDGAPPRPGPALGGRHLGQPASHVAV
ncbi:MAG: galactose oxidase-like domain-containing protein [Acidimicrobiia bacterium]